MTKKEVEQAIDLKTPLCQRVGDIMYRLLLETDAGQVEIADASGAASSLQKEVEALRRKDAEQDSSFAAQLEAKYNAAGAALKALETALRKQAAADKSELGKRADKVEAGLSAETSARKKEIEVLEETLTNRWNEKIYTEVTAATDKLTEALNTAINEMNKSVQKLREEWDEVKPAMATHVVGPNEAKDGQLAVFDVADGQTGGTKIRVYDIKADELVTREDLVKAIQDARSGGDK